MKLSRLLPVIGDITAACRQQGGKAAANQRAYSRIFCSHNSFVHGKVPYFSN